jgi:hypothetical protein
MAAIQSSTKDEHIRKQIGTAFGWGEYPNVAIPSRMLLAALEEPEWANRGPRTVHSYAEAVWITNVFLYRSTDSGKKLNPISDEFRTSASKYFGIRFKALGEAKPTEAAVRTARPRTGKLPHVSSVNDAWISSGTHLRTAWYGNTFSMSTPFPGEFVDIKGAKRQVDMLTSEMSMYPHARTDRFEAVVLPANSAYMVAILPAPGVNILDLERELAISPETLDAALRRELGLVTMPTFRIKFEKNLRAELEQMGISRVFEDLGPLITIPDSHLTEVEQEIDIQVDKDGIHADAETVAGVVYGGIGVGATPFHMRINRPFVFLVRENNTNALLFLGSVVDPRDSGRREASSATK